MIAKLKYIFVAVVLLSLVSCKDKQARNQEVEKPENLLSEEEFVNTYIEIRLLESSIREEVKDVGAAKEVAERSVDQMLEEKGMTYEDFQKSFQYYGQQPRLMYSIFERILNKLNTDQQKVTDTLNQRKQKNQKTENNQEEM